MNMQALATPASRRSHSNGVAWMKKPLSAMNTVAASAPPSSNVPGAMRRSSAGVASAPSR